MNFLTENKIEQYADLLTRIEEIATASEQAGDSLKEAEKRLSDMALLIKNVTTYQKTSPSMKPTAKPGIRRNTGQSMNGVLSSMKRRQRH